RREQQQRREQRHQQRRHGDVREPSQHISRTTTNASAASSPDTLPQWRARASSASRERGCGQGLTSLVYSANASSLRCSTADTSTNRCGEKVGSPAGGPHSVDDGVSKHWIAFTPGAA